VLPLAGITILLDAGHGGSDHGAIRDGINEKDINLAVTLKVRDLLVSQGATVLLTRKDDSALTLDERKALIAQNSPTLFLSIHTNAHTNDGIDGIEAYYWNDASPTLAQSIYQAVVDGLGERGNWVRKRELAVVHHEFAPAALIEIGYLSNDADRKLLVDEKYQSRVADSIYSGILDYVSKQRSGAGNPAAKPTRGEMSVVGLQRP
jgi:N-acetylmuramoyl-L-alanine amidase